jgi:hypothetical protein
MFVIVDTIVRDSSYAREQILDSLTTRKYDDIMAYYLLLGIRTIEVNDLVSVRYVDFIDAR